MPITRLYATGSAIVSRAGATRWLTGAVGAAVAIALAGLFELLVRGGAGPAPWLIASTGASAVLVFNLPASPLSQPWSVAGGHLLAAVMGLELQRLVPEPWLAAGLAVGLVIGAMNLARCLHPPAGGTALIAVLAPHAGEAQGWAALLYPLGLNLAVLLAVAVAWNRMTGHSYPHRAARISAPAAWVGHITDEDLDAVLSQWDEVLDIGRDDLLDLLHAAETRVFARTQTGAGQR